MDKLAELVRDSPNNTILIGDFNLPDVDWEVGTCGARTRSLLDALDDIPDPQSHQHQHPDPFLSIMVSILCTVPVPNNRN